MLKKALISILLTISTLAAYADLGDTYESSKAKYGEGKQDDHMKRDVWFRHNGWDIMETFNDNWICVSVEFVKLNGFINRQERKNMDVNNLPSDVNTINGNGWIMEKWKKNLSNSKDCVCWTWKSRNLFFQIVEGLSRFGNDSVWFCTRQYMTQEGIDIMRQELKDWEDKKQAGQNNDNEDNSTGPDAKANI